VGCGEALTHEVVRQNSSRVLPWCSVEPVARHRRTAPTLQIRSPSLKFSRQLALNHIAQKTVKQVMKVNREIFKVLVFA
jgi:hypothetical protein